MGGIAFPAKMAAILHSSVIPAETTELGKEHGILGTNNSG